MGKPLQVFGPSRACGGCTACCTALFVEALQKQPMETCEHVGHEVGQGCGIYGSRPTECRAFDCAWRFNLPQLGLRESDRPDKSGVVLHLVNPAFGAMTAHAARPGALNEAPAKSLLGRLAKKGIAFVVIEGVQVEGVYAPDEKHPLIERVKAMVRGGAA